MFIVTVNEPGYLPGYEGETFATLQAARENVKAELRETLRCDDSVTERDVVEACERADTMQPGESIMLGGMSHNLDVVS